MLFYHGDIYNNLGIIMAEKREKYLTPEQASRMLMISHATLKNWLRLGKIVPQKSYDNKPLFSEKYLQDLLVSFTDSDSNVLQSRRNKKMLRGTIFPSGYIKSNSPNAPILRQLAELSKSIPDCEFEKLLPAVCADVFAKIITKKGILKYTDTTGCIGSYIGSLISKNGDIERITADYPEIFSLNFVKYENEDTVGAVYLVLQRANKRKARGAYYTPAWVIEHIYKDLTGDIPNGKKILDPCCGTGNFLLQLPNDIAPEFIYGCDCDELAVTIARINFSLKYSIDDVNFIEKHIIHCDFLQFSRKEKFDLIVGNPPWGGEFSKNQKSTFNCNTDSFSLITEHAVNHLQKNGTLFFLLPQAVLSVKKHLSIRNFILRNCCLKHIEYLGELFFQVNCPAIILGIKKTKQLEDFCFSHHGKQWILPKTTTISATAFNFCPPWAQCIIERMESIANSTLLAGNAEFALGIVTGNNAKYISNKPNEQNEVIIRGTDLSPFEIKLPKSYINFTPEHFQQVAPEFIYRANEKLLYKFISRKLIFAYDDRQRLSLNSCNILIPNQAKFNIKYILAVLNSSAVQFYFRYKFDSVKVLRQHLEQIPIPPVSAETLKVIVNLTDKIIVGDAQKNFTEQLDKIISKLYNLTEKEHEMLKEIY